MSTYLVLAPVVMGFATAAFTGFARDAHSARRRAALGALSMLGLAVAAAFLARIDEALVSFDAVATTGPLFGLDGLSAPLFPFVAGLLVAVVMGTPNRFANTPFFVRLVATGTLYLGLLATRTPFGVALLWVLTSMPTVLELRGRHAGRVFFFHQLFSSLLVASGVIAASFYGPASRWAGPLVLLGVMVREGVFPFHGWVPRFFERAPLGTALLFMQPQIGAYVLARFIVTGPVGEASLLLDVLGVVTVLYGAGLALVQRSSRRALGYLTVSQSALVLVGLADGGLLGATGALLVIIALGLAQTGFGVALWAVETRRGALHLDVDGGGQASTPALAGATLVLGLASVGLPGTLAFVAEDLVFHATLEARPWVGVAMVIATALNGISVVRIAFRLFGGRRRESGEGDLSARERLVLGLLGATLVVLGLLPQPLLAPAKTALEHLGVPPNAASTSPVASAHSEPRAASSKAN